MLQRIWGSVGVAALLLVGTGCVCCGNKGYSEARVVGPDCDPPLCQRNQVHVFAIGGLTPSGVFGIEGFREELNRQGFAKVATGQMVHTGWMSREMRRIQSDNPDAVFVIVGLDGGGASAVKLAESARSEGLLVSGLILIGCESHATALTAELRTLKIEQTHTLQSQAPTNTVESVTIPDVSRYALLVDPRTTELVTRFLCELSAGVVTTTQHFSLPTDYPYAPPERPEIDPLGANDWVYLFDQPRTSSPAIDPSTIWARQPLPQTSRTVSVRQP